MQYLGWKDLHLPLRGRSSGDEEDLLSSGQVSPICMHACSLFCLDCNLMASILAISKTHNPFILDPSDTSYNLAQGSTPNLNKDDPEYDRRVKSFLARQPRRHRDESRVSSWSGVGSAEEKKKSADKSTEGESEADNKRRILRHDIQR